MCEWNRRIKWKKKSKRNKKQHTARNTKAPLLLLPPSSPPTRTNLCVFYLFFFAAHTQKWNGFGCLCVTSSTDELHDNEKPSTNWQVEKNCVWCENIWYFFRKSIKYTCEYVLVLACLLACLDCVLFLFCFFSFTHSLCWSFRAATLHGNIIPIQFSSIQCNEYKPRSGLLQSNFFAFLLSRRCPKNYDSHWLQTLRGEFQFEDTWAHRY